MQENLVLNISQEITINAIEYHKTLSVNNSGLMSLYNQLIRSSTSIGANISEAQHPQSKADFISKMNIALKEAEETRYWLISLYKTNLLNEEFYTKQLNKVESVIKLLVKILNSSKN